MFVQQLPLRLS